MNNIARSYTLPPLFSPYPPTTYSQHPVEYIVSSMVVYVWYIIIITYLHNTAVRLHTIVIMLKRERIVHSKQDKFGEARQTIPVSDSPAIANAAHYYFRPIPRSVTIRYVNGLNDVFHVT